MNMIFYERPRKTYSKNKTLTLNHSAAKSTTSSLPGFCNKISKSLRLALQPHVSLLQHKSVQQHFTHSLHKWLMGKNPASLDASSNLPHIQGFNFNEDSSITETWKIRFKVVSVSENLLELHIPAFVPWDTITAPAQTMQIVCSITTASCNVMQPVELGSSHYSFIIPYDNHPLPARVIPLTIPASGGCLSITTVGLQYGLKNGKTYTRPSYMPCSVIDARYR
jgi:hypothetical protein